MNYKKKLVIALSEKLESFSLEEVENMIEVPPDRDMGDFAFPCFKLAKTFRKAPNQIAADLKDLLRLDESFEKVEAKGPYVNFFINKKNLNKGDN